MLLIKEPPFRSTDLMGTFFQSCTLVTLSFVASCSKKARWLLISLQYRGYFGFGDGLWL
jgi:hypothetical protein